MDILPQLTCACNPGFVYKNQNTFLSHKKTKMHTLWATLADRIRSKEFENEVERLKRRLEHKEEIEKELLARIRTLEDQVEYWKKASEGIFI